MILVLWGRDDFSLSEHLRQLQQGLGEPGLAEANTTRLEGRFSLRELAEACAASPFFAPRRLVIASGLLARLDPRRRTPPPTEAELKALAGALDGVPETTLLVFTEERLDRDNPLLKGLRGRAEIRQFPPPQGAELQNWIRRRVEMSGGRITPGGVRLLADAVGINLWSLATEVDKLRLYCGEKPIDEEAVRQVASQVREANIYRLAESLLQGRAAGAGRGLHQLLDSGVPPGWILGRMAEEFRNLVLAQEMLQEGAKEDEMGQRLNIHHPFRLKQTMTQARRYPFQRIRTVLAGLLETDLAIKTGRWDEGLAVDFLIANLCPG